MSATDGTLDSGKPLNMVVTIPASHFDKDPNSHLYTGQFGLEGDHLLEAVGSQDSGFLNSERGIHGITVQSIHGLNKGTVGLSFTHGYNEDESPLQSSHRVLHCDGATGEAAAYHIVHCADGPPTLNSETNHVALDIVQSEDVDDVTRRATRWNDMSVESVTHGVSTVTHQNPDGTSVTRHIIAKQDTEGRPSAIHRLISLNQDQAAFCDGAFSKTNRIMLPGEKFVMTDHHYQSVKESLSKALTTNSPWKKGLNVRAYSEVKPEHALSISLQLNRKRKDAGQLDPVKLPDDAGSVATTHQGVVTSNDVSAAFAKRLPGEAIKIHTAGASEIVPAADDSAPAAGSDE